MFFFKLLNMKRQAGIPWTANFVVAIFLFVSILTRYNYNFHRTQYQFKKKKWNIGNISDHAGWISPRSPNNSVRKHKPVENKVSYCVATAPYSPAL